MDEILDLALTLSEGKEATASAIQRVSQKTNPSASAWAFGQWDLRKRAKGKFQLAEKMLFVREALEQATHESVAEYHASLFPRDVLVADLTTGIGADLIGLSRRGPTKGFELDAERLSCARNNLEVHGLASSLELRDSLGATWDFEYAYADPARRIEGRRTLDPTEFEPNPLEIADRFTKIKLGVMKLSPLLPDTFLESLGSHLEFISFGGECREALVLLGSEAVPGRYAVHVESGQRLEEGNPRVTTCVPSEFLLDLDPAAVRAHCAGTLCEKFEATPLGDSNGYLTSDLQSKSVWFRSYRILYEGKGDVKSTKQAVRELGGDVFEVKQRGVKGDVHKLKRELSLKGKLPLSLVLWPDGQKVRHLLVTSLDL